MKVAVEQLRCLDVIIANGLVKRVVPEMHCKVT